MAKKFANVRVTWDLVILGLLFTLWVFASLTTKNFISATNVSQIFSNTSEITIMAFAMTLLIIAGEIDLSIAANLALSSSVLGYTYRAGAPIVVAIFLALIVGTICGALNGFLVTKVKLNSLAVTIATMALFRGLANALVGSKPISEFPDAWTSFGFDTFGTSFVPKTLPMIIIFAIIFALVLHRTPFGRKTFAIGQSVDAAKFAGVNVDRHKWLLFTLTGTMSGVASVVYTFRFSLSQPDNGTGLELLVISACLLGGISIFGGVGTMWGVLGGVLLAGSVESWLTLNEVNAQWRTIVTGILLLISVATPVAMDIVKRRRASGAIKKG
jgi:rhamnose transport system permease protein